MTAGPEERLPKDFGKYRLLKRLATGGMAEIFLASCRDRPGERVVVKRVLPNLVSSSSEFLSMFLDEARIAANIKHPNVVRIDDVGQVDGAHYLAMEYIHGEDVRRIYNQAYKLQRSLPLSHSIRVVAESALGLHAAHQYRDNLTGKLIGVVHRDVSPQNIIVTYEGSVKVVDFGIAKAANKVNQTRAGVLKGKYSYMSPEQALGDSVDARTDIFALGIILYETTTGTRLFKKPTELATLQAVIKCDVTPPSEVLDGYPRELEQIVLRSLQKDPDDRYQSAEHFAADLFRFLQTSGLFVEPRDISAFMADLFADRLREEREDAVRLAEAERMVLERPSGSPRERASPERSDAVLRSDPGVTKAARPDGPRSALTDAGRGEPARGDGPLRNPASRSGEHRAVEVRAAAALDAPDTAVSSDALEALLLGASLSGVSTSGGSVSGASVSGVSGSGVAGALVAGLGMSGAVTPHAEPPASAPPRSVRPTPALADDEFSRGALTLADEEPSEDDADDDDRTRDGRRPVVTSPSGDKTPDQAPTVVNAVAYRSVAGSAAGSVAGPEPERAQRQKRVEGTEFVRAERAARAPREVRNLVDTRVFGDPSSLPPDDRRTIPERAARSPTGRSGPPPKAAIVGGLAALFVLGLLLAVGLAQTVAPDAPSRPGGTEASGGELTVHTEPGARVFRGEVALGAARSDGEAGPFALPAGQQTIRVVFGPGNVRARTVVVRAGGVHEIEVRARVGALKVTVAPWARVKIDGEDRGITPLASISLGEGEHAVALENPTLGLGYQARVTVEAGKTVELKVDIQAVGRPLPRPR